MTKPPLRQTVDLSAFADLVVILLGLRVNRLAGLKTMLRLGPKIARSAEALPDGLLYHQNILFSLAPPHVGIRQYWRDLASLEAWSRSAPHRDWWRGFLEDSGGTGFWHECYLMRGGMEGVYIGVEAATGFLTFAPALDARGARFTARERACVAGTGASPVVGEAELYDREKVA